MNDVSFSKEYNCLISILAILNAYFSIIPHFNGKTIDVDHKILVVVIGVFFLLFLMKSRLRISQGTGFALLIAVISGIFVSFHASVFRNTNSIQIKLHRFPISNAASPLL
jgi:RsiW-degrading membrane proteinase PrsW (M82 family)